MKRVLLLPRKTVKKQKNKKGKMILEYQSMCIPIRFQLENSVECIQLGCHGQNLARYDESYKH